MYSLRNIQLSSWASPSLVQATTRRKHRARSANHLDCIEAALHSASHSSRRTLTRTEPVLWSEDATILLAEVVE